MDFAVIAVVGVIAIVVLLVMMAMQGGHSEQGTVEALEDLRDRPYDQSGLRSVKERMRLSSNAKTAQKRVELADMKLAIQQKLNEAETLIEQERYIPVNVEMNQKERVAKHMTTLEQEATEQHYQRTARDHGYNGELYREVTLLREAANIELGKARTLKAIDREDYRERLEIDQDQVTRAQLEPYEHRKQKVRMLSEYREELEDEDDSSRRATLKREIRRLEDELDDENGPVQATPEQKKRRALPAQKRGGGSRAEDQADEEQVPPQKPRRGGKGASSKRGGEGESRSLAWDDRRR